MLTIIATNNKVICIKNNLVVTLNKVYKRISKFKIKKNKKKNLVANTVYLLYNKDYIFILYYFIYLKKLAMLC